MKPIKRNQSQIKDADNLTKQHQLGLFIEIVYRENYRDRKVRSL